MTTKFSKDDILFFIYNRTQQGFPHKFVTLGEIETEFGASGSTLRASLEDLKDDILISEHNPGFQITIDGINYGRSRWV